VIHADDGLSVSIRYGVVFDVSCDSAVFSPMITKT